MTTQNRIRNRQAGEDIVLPPYPAYLGPNAAAQVRNRRKGFQKAISELERELARAEDAFAEAFAEADRRQQTRDRLKAVTAQQKRIQP